MKSRIDLIAKEFKNHQHCFLQFTRLNVLLQYQAISMALLHKAFGLEPNDNRYRHKLKEHLINDYRNKIMFVKSHYHYPEIVIGADSIITYY